MSNNARTEIIARIRSASRDTTSNDIIRELRGIEPAPPVSYPDEELAARFLANVLKHAGKASCAANRSDATKIIAAYLYGQYRNRKLVAGPDPRLAAMPWRDGGLLPRFGEAVDGDTASVSYARLGVAETGSIVTFTGKSNPAANNLLAEDHIVLLDIEDLVVSLTEAWARITQLSEKEGRPRGIQFISGPSSTADIAFHMVMGAHGPRRWHVILVGDLPEETLDDARRYAGLS